MENLGLGLLIRFCILPRTLDDFTYIKNFKALVEKVSRLFSVKGQVTNIFGFIRQQLSSAT